MALPDYLSEITEEMIRERMLASVPADVDKTEGSYIWDALAPAASQLYLASLWAREVLRRGFATSTFGTYLDARCEERGLRRREAVRATGEVTMTGVPQTVVPVGTRVATPADAMTATSSVEYETLQEGQLDDTGTAVIPIAAVEAGTVGNVPVGAIQILVDPVPGITGVTNASVVSGGAEAESDESLLARYLVKVREPGTSGNKADYKQWALEVPGISGAQVEPLWNGPGTVRVFLLDSEKRAPDQMLVNAVQAYIAPVDGMGEGKAPIGAAVTVVPAVEVPIDIEVELSLASGTTLQEVQQMLEAGVETYLRQLAFADPLVRYTRIASILLDIPPVIDFSNLKVNGDDENIEMAIGEVAVLGTVTLHVQ
jgi:uncharacterized phage protein gp47/JayE